MFEKSRFKKTYALLSPYIKNKDLIKKILKEQSRYESFYHDQEDNFKKLINLLNQIYSIEDVEMIVTEIDTEWYENPRTYKIEKLVESLKNYIMYAKKYDNVEILRTLKINEYILDVYLYSSDIQKHVLKLCFEKYYINPFKIRTQDLKEIFMAFDNKDIMEEIYYMVRNNNLDFLDFIMNELPKCNINLNINSILKLREEVNDNLYSDECRSALGNDDFIKLLKYYFYTNGQDKKILDNLLNEKNYNLIKDFLYLSSERKFVNNIGETEYNKELIELKRIDNNIIINILFNFVGVKEYIKFEYLFQLKRIIPDIYNELYNEHKELIDILAPLYSDSFFNLDKETKRNVYNYFKLATKEKRENIINTFIEINKKLISCYKKYYSSSINKATDIINKAEDKVLTDSHGNSHNLRVYELNNNENFNFLITVMHHSVRRNGPNMYGRPQHLHTIENPSYFDSNPHNGSEIISTSLINHMCINTFVGPYADVMYIFGEIESEDIVGISVKDGRYPPKIDDKRGLFEYRPVSIDDITRSNILNRDYNEIAIKRKRDNGNKVRPSAILCYDTINDISIKHAEYFNIPIIVINTKTYSTGIEHYTKKEETKSKLY